MKRNREEKDNRMNVLAITCHPDDFEIYCGGTLLKCKERGDTVTVCHVANGNMGHMVIEPDELREIRLEEARRSAQMAGFRICTCDIGDLTIRAEDTNLHDKLVKVIRDAKPDFIITHAPDDYMTDHIAVSELIFKASFSATVPHYRPDLGEAAKLTPIYYCDNDCLLRCEPEEYVDITSVMEKKLEMLSCHESQIKWLYDHDGCDILDDVRTMSRLRGIQCSRKYAEGFRVCRTGSRNTTERLLP